jgi:outer membrane protein assembly factor BamB
MTRLHGQQGGNGPRGTPTVDGTRLYVEGAGGTIACLEMATGKVVWSKSLVSDFGGAVPNWGFSESPLVDGEKVIFTPGGRGAALVAFNKQTGDVIWKSQVPGDDRAGYSSCIAAVIEGQRQYIQFTAVGVIGVAAKDGKFLWRYNNPGNRTGNISTPIYRDNIVFAATAYNTGAGAVRLAAAGGGFSATEIYFTRSMMNHHGGLVLVGDCLYGFDNNTLRCLDFKTGDIKWSAPSVGKGSVVCAGGLLYARGENRTGSVAVIEATPTGYAEKGRFSQPDRTDKPAWAHPVVVGGRLYLRDQDLLLCYDVKGKGAASPKAAEAGRQMAD